MMELWNQKDLAMPPINTYKAVKTNIDIKHLHNVFREGIEFFNNEKFMYAEHVVLSRIIYRMKQKFRSAKDFKAMEKLNKALKNYFNMNMSQSLNKFLEIIPGEYKKKIYLPTKNLLDYILVRLQGLVKLMERIVETSKIAAYLLDQRMQTGHFWKIAFIVFALVSRVYTVGRYTTKFACDFYRKVLPFSSQLKNTGNEWLPQNYIFPKDLQEWMNVDWLEFDDEVQIIEAPTEIPDVMKLFDLVDDDDDDIQISDEYFMVDDDDDEACDKVINDPKKNNVKMKNKFLEELGKLRGFNNKEDTGEVIEIEDSFREYADTVEANITEHNEKSDSNGSAIQQPSQRTSPIHLIDDSITNAIVNELNQEGNVTMSSRAAFAKNNSESYGKNTLRNNASCKSIDSNSYISINESDDDVRVSDESVIVVPDNKIMTATIVDSDEDVLIVSGPSLLEIPAKLIKQKRKKPTKNVERRLEYSSCEDTVIIVPDTPLPKQSGGSAILSADDDTVIVVDTPRRSLKKEKNLIRKNTMVGKTSKDRANLEVSISKKQKKKLKNKGLHLGLNTENIQQSGNPSQGTQGNDSSFEVVQPKIIKKNTIIKVKNEFSKSLKRNSKKLKLAIKNLPESSNLVRQNTHIPLTIQKNQENTVAINKNAQNSSHKKRKPKPNSLDHNQKKIKLADKTATESINLVSGHDATESINLVSGHEFIPLNNQSNQNKGVPKDKNLHKRKFKKGKPQKNALDLTSNTKKLKLAVTTLPENSNLVNRNTQIPLGIKKRQKGDVSINKNSNTQILKKIKLEPNSFNPNNDNKQEQSVYTIPDETSKISKSSFKAEASSKLHLAIKNKKKKKKNVIGNKEQSKSSPTITDKTPVASKINMSHTKKIRTTGQNFKKEKLDINTTKADQNTSIISKKSRKMKNRIHKNYTLNLNKTKVTQNVNNSSQRSENQTGSSFQNNSSINIKQEIPWEYSNEKQQLNNSIGFNLANIKKEKNPDISMVTHMPQASSTPKTDIILSRDNKSKTVQIKGNSKNNKKKKPKMLNSLAQSNISLKIKKEINPSHVKAENAPKNMKKKNKTHKPNM